MRASTVAFQDSVYFDIKELSEARGCTFSAWVNAALAEALLRERSGVPVVVASVGKPPLMTALSVEVRRQRRELGWSQAQLATYLGSTQPAVSSLEGGVMPMAKLREAVATWLGVSFAEVGVMARTFLKSVPGGSGGAAVVRTVAVPREEVMRPTVEASVVRSTVVRAVEDVVPDAPPHTDEDCPGDVDADTDGDDPYQDDGFYKTLLGGDTAITVSEDDDDYYEEPSLSWKAFGPTIAGVQREREAGFVGWLALAMDGSVLGRGATRRDVVGAARRGGGVLREIA